MKIKHHLIILLITFCYTELFVAQNGIVRPVHGANYDNTCKGITAKYVNANITEDGNYTNNCSANYYVDIVTTEDIARGYQVKFLENQRANWNLNWMDLRLGDKLIWLGGSPNWVKKNGYWFAENAILADCGNGCTVRKIDSEFQKKSNTTDFKLENFEDDVGMSSGSNLEQNRQRWENNLNKATTGRVVSYVDTDGTKKTIPVDTKV
ncbi:hypothetical protein KC901_03560, partial [Patescibacteria group bacterium]|nr:hypothetical protein [Patescibacteria group bacterium]